jgi:hypothetical protein
MNKNMDFTIWQEKQRKKLYNLLGDLPSRDYPIKVIEKEEIEQEKYILEKIILDLNGEEMVPAYLVKPKNFSGKLPAILFNHSHGGKYEWGKEELIKGNSYMYQPPYAEEIVQLNCIGLCIDHYNFGERSGRTEWNLYKALIWQNKVLWGLMVFDSLKAIDYLVSRPDIDSHRIGTLGMSMGSTMAWWISALDTRIKVCIDICCLTDFHTYLEIGNLEGHGIYYFVPGLIKYFSTAKINSLIAPRFHLSLNGNFDSLTPVKGLEKIDKELKKIYDKSGASENWKILRFNIGHRETFYMRKKIIEFLKTHLLNTEGK